MNPEEPFILVVDDDPRVRRALCNLLESVGFRTAAFGTAADFLRFEKPDCPSCLILDLELPDINGLEVQQQLSDIDGPPIVFLTGHGDVPSSVRAMKSGAVGFLLKPVRKQELLPAISEALERDDLVRTARFTAADLRKRYQQLTPREQEVLPFVVLGFPNKQTASELGNSEYTGAAYSINHGYERSMTMNRRVVAASLQSIRNFLTSSVDTALDSVTWGVVVVKSQSFNACCSSAPDRASASMLVRPGASLYQRTLRDNLFLATTRKRVKQYIRAVPIIAFPCKL